MKICFNNFMFWLLSACEYGNLPRSKAKKILDRHLNEKIYIDKHYLSLGNVKITVFGIKDHIWDRHNYDEFVTHHRYGDTNYSVSVNRGFLNTRLVKHNPPRPEGWSSGTDVCHISLVESGGC